MQPHDPKNPRQRRKPAVAEGPTADVGSAPGVCFAPSIRDQTAFAASAAQDRQGPLRRTLRRRSQLLIALGQAEPEDPAKISLLWAAEWIVSLRTEDSIREEFLHLMSNDLLLPAFPEYMAGFLLALEFTPRISRLAVELLSRAFARLPDEVLVPWLPTLVVTLRPLGTQLMQTLVCEAGLAFPRRLDELPIWEAPWEPQLPDLQTADDTPGAAVDPSSQLSPTE
ncbi:MAG TPA: hypothetical protein ENJ18_00405, partial [Nannocystis exedens]|nr:hypothetical protein [Nannocystis exedens]